MAAIIQYDPESTPVANRVVRYLPSVNTPEWESVDNVLFNPVLPDGFNASSAKVVDGAVFNLTADDLAAIESDEMDSSRAGRWFGKSPTQVLNSSRYESIL